MTELPRRVSRDPRYYQIAILSTLLCYGVAVLDFGVQWQHAAAIIGTALGAQWLAGRTLGLAGFDPLSPLISALSLTLLLRTNSLSIAVLAALLAIGSKFLLRVNGKHVFNPANFALVTLMFTSEQAWLSSGQWGNTALLAFGFACLGLLILNRARRAETSLAFIMAFALLLFSRAVWLGDPLSIPLHQLQSGALLLFAFFMISDPKTSPDAASGRVLYGALVACVACFILFGLNQPHGPVIALILCAPLVPLIDRYANGRRYVWRAAGSLSRDSSAAKLKQGTSV
ncbi:MAG: RnfABCDGE type electron transport complex subunit D [Pseudomonadota bacterium]